MLSIEQCRGARGILGWTQQDLADASGLSKTAINNFEKGHSDIKAESAKAIRMAFESADIEFLDNNGIRKKSEDMRILRGINARANLLADMHMSLASCDKDVLIISPSNYLFDSISTEKCDAYMSELAKYNLSQRLITGANTRIKNTPSISCRYLSENEKYAQLTSYVYANKVAFELWENSMIVVISSADAHAAERSRFEHLWNSAKER